VPTRLLLVQEKSGEREAKRERERERLSRARVTLDSLSRISLGKPTPRPPSMRGGTCPLLPLKMQGESLQRDLHLSYSRLSFAAPFTEDQIARFGNGRRHFRAARETSINAIRFADKEMRD